MLWDDYYLGVPQKGVYKEVFNTNLKKFGGSGLRNRKLLATRDELMHGFEQYISVTVPPLTTMVFQYNERQKVRI